MLGWELNGLPNAPMRLRAETRDGVRLIVEAEIGICAEGIVDDRPCGASGPANMPFSRTDSEGVGMPNVPAGAFDAARRQR